MAVRRINAALRCLDWSQVENSLEAPEGGPYELCHAARDDWGRYVLAESEMLESRMMVWCEGRILIVDMVTALHQGVVGGIREAIMDATGTGRNDLACHGAAYIGGRAIPAGVSILQAYLEPNCCFSPRFNLPGAVLPPTFTWGKFHTLKMEIGIYRTWGGPGGLDYKADAWRQYPGVEYVLCIRISADLNVRQYRLDSFENGIMPPTDIVNGSVLAFDARRLLGLPPGADLPVGFNDPVRANLFDVVEPILAQERRDAVLEQAFIDAAAGRQQQ